ncbi:MAG: hypothetical protein QM796_04910 [Chthoniobacteraceae bacterium]
MKSAFQFLFGTLCLGVTTVCWWMLSVSIRNGTFWSMLTNPGVHTRMYLRNHLDHGYDINPRTFILSLLLISLTSAILGGWLFVAALREERRDS